MASAVRLDPCDGMTVELPSAVLLYELLYIKAKIMMLVCNDRGNVVKTSILHEAD